MAEEGLEMIEETKFMRNIKFITGIVTAILLLFYIYGAVRAQQVAGSIFALQCGTIDSAYQYTYAVRDGELVALRQGRVRNPDRLMTLETTPGVWYGYESAAPFGGTYPDNANGYWLSTLIMQTECGEMQTWAWNNQDGTLIVFAFNSMQANCDANGDHCGRHGFQFYYTTLEEWNRATGR